MAKTDTPKKMVNSIIKITWLNYNPANYDEYSKKFMTPLIGGLLQRLQLNKGE